MSEDILAPVLAAILAFIVVGVPVIALSARIAIKPIVKAIVMLRQSNSPDEAVTEARMRQLEADVALLSAQLQQMNEVAAFNRQLGEPQEGRKTP